MRPIRVTPKPQSTMRVETVARARVRSTGASGDADGSASIIRSAMDDAKMPPTAAVELSGDAIAKGNELPIAITAPRTADAMKVAAMP